MDQRCQAVALREPVSDVGSESRLVLIVLFAILTLLVVMVCMLAGVMVYLLRGGGAHPAVPPPSPDEPAVEARSGAKDAADAGDAVLEQLLVDELRARGVFQTGAFLLVQAPRAPWRGPGRDLLSRPHQRREGFQLEGVGVSEA